MNSVPQSSRSHADWPYPSPSSTPQSDQLDPFLFDHPATTHWSSGEAPAGAPFTQAFPSLASMPPRPAQYNANQKSRKDTGQAQAQAGQSLTDSFIGAFDGTSLQDAFPAWQPTPEHPVPQMQTPPPTRDTSVKRAARPNPAPFATPSTVRSRRHSTFGDEWLRRSVDQAPLEESPLQLTPLQFSPPDSQAPLTAPALARNILWDPESHNNSLFTSYSAGTEDPFFSSSPVRSGQWPSGKSSNRFVNALNKTDSSGHRRSLGGTPVRPHSVHLGAFPALDQDRAAKVASSVNPSMLWSSQGSVSGQLKISDPPSTTVGENIAQQPYQYHFEELKRERELRQGKPWSGRSRAANPMSLPPSSTMPNLRRSLTDSKARRSFHEGLFSSPEEGQGGVLARAVPRHSSPLKRQRLDGGASPVRKSISLTVDDKGRARTVVTPTGGSVRSPPRRDSTLLLPEDSESSDGGEMLGVRSTGGRRHDAQDALREMLRGRQEQQQQQQQQQQQRKRVSAARQNLHPAMDSFALEEILPATAMAQGEASASQLAHARDIGENTRCICDKNMAKAYMIQWNWLHLECLAMGPEQAPQVYVCAFCTGGAAVGPGNAYAMPLHDPGQGPYFG